MTELSEAQWAEIDEDFERKLEAMRLKTIEECARVAESYLEDDYTPPVMIDKIAAAIRALKEKL